MGSFDCYCALCSGPLGIFNIKLGSQKAKALAKRRKRVNQKKKRLAGEDVMHEDSGEWKEMEEKEFPEKKKPEEGADMRALFNEHGDEAVDVDMVDAEDDDEEMVEGGNDEDEDSDSSWDSNGSSISTIDEELASDEDFGDNEVDELAAEEHEWEDNPHPYPSSDSGSAFDNDHDDDEYNSDWSNASDLNIEGYDFHRDTRDETASSFSYYEKHTYDPVTLSKENVQWIDRCRVLGINPELEDDKVAFISGRGRYDDLFDFNIKSHGSDPRDPIIGEHPVYHCYEPEEMTATFPFHEECFKLLVRCLGHDDKKEVDKDVLYEVMIQNVQEMSRHLEFDYGNVEGAEQFWECHAGAEWSVTDPGTKEGIEEFVKSMLPAQLFHRSERQDLDLSHKVKHDPLNVLPYDILYGIFANLSIKDTKSIINASMHVFACTREAAFWRHMIRMQIVPFFWELDGFLKDTTFPDTFDWKGAFQWLNKITKPTFAMDGPLMAIANRRRIWEVCQQLAPLYHGKLNAEAYAEPDDAEAAAVMEQAKTYDTRVTMFPQPPANETHMSTVQLIRSWSEPEYRACDLDTYWADQHGGLIGISVNFGSVQRLFGNREGVKGHSLHIKAGEWIKEICVSVRKLELNCEDKHKDLIEGKHDPRTIMHSYINGMKICLTSGEQKYLKSMSYDCPRRSFTVLPDMHLIGLTGEFAANGAICSLALLQAPNPSSPPPTKPAYSHASTLLFSPSSHCIYSQPHRCPFPIIDHPNLTLHTLPPPPSALSPSFLHTDMLPHAAQLWAQSPNEYKLLKRISTLEFADENGPSSILGIWHKTTSEYGSASHIGTNDPVRAQRGEYREPWDEQYMKHFDIDGPGGEVVIEVHASTNRRGFKLVTNRGREGAFGECEGDVGWDVVRAETEKGEVVLGVSACFGDLGGWSEEEKRWGHWAVRELGVVVSKGWNG